MIRKIRFAIFVFPIFILSVFNSVGQKNLQIISTLTFPNQTLAGCWHYENATGNKYALVGAKNGIAIIDITDSVNPALIFQVPGISNLWHEVKVIGNYAYAVTEGNDATGVMNGMQIINLSYLPDSAPMKFYQGDGAIAGQLVSAHSITAAGRHVFVNGHNITALGRGVLILDISDPWNPVYTGAETLNYCHDSYVRGDTMYTSDIYVGRFTIFDISNPANPVYLVNQPTPANLNHNTWLSDDGHFLYAADERTGAPLASFDITDIHNIELLDQYYTINHPTSEVHNVRVFHDFLVCADYGSQLTLVDASRPANLIEVGNFPTGTSLCWDADPYLSNGLIIATDMSSGIFYVFQPDYKHACYLEGTVTDSVTGFPISGALISFQSINDSSSSMQTGDYKTGWADPGTFTVDYSKTGYFTKSISGISLQQGILTIQDVQLVPLSAGLPSIGKPMEISIAPNPVRDMLNITSTHPLKNILIYSADGKLAAEINDGFDLTGKISAVNISNLAQGFYSICVTNSENTKWIKFVKE